MYGNRASTAWHPIFSIKMSIRTSRKDSTIKFIVESIILSLHYFQISIFFHEMHQKAISPSINFLNSTERNRLKKDLVEQPEVNYLNQMLKSAPFQSCLVFELRFFNVPGFFNGGCLSSCFRYNFYIFEYNN